MFVTSVDVEADRWGVQHEFDKTDKHLQEQRQGHGVVDGAEDVQVLNYGSAEPEAVVMEVEDVTLTETISTIANTSTPASSATAKRSPNDTSAVDWSLADKQFSQQASSASKPIGSLSDLRDGMLVGWNALALNPITFSPEIMLHLGRVKSIRASTDRGGDDGVVIKPILRPGEEDEEGHEEEEEQMYTMSEVKEMVWRSLPL